MMQTPQALMFTMGAPQHLIQEGAEGPYCPDGGTEVSCAPRAGPIPQGLPQGDQELISQIRPSRKVSHKNVGSFLL